MDPTTEEVEGVSLELSRLLGGRGCRIGEVLVGIW